MGPPPRGIFYVDSDLGLKWEPLYQPDNVYAEVDIAELGVDTELVVDTELEVDTELMVESEPSLDINDPHRMASQKCPCNTGRDLEILVNPCQYCIACSLWGKKALTNK